jgi:hypothetical protein
MSKTATYALIDSYTFPSAQSSFTFSSIPGTYTDLRVVFNGGVVSGSLNLYMQYNSDTGGNYSTRNITGDGGSAFSLSPLSNVTNIICNYYGYLTADMNTNISIDIMDYSNTTTNKTNLTRSNNAGNGTALVIGMWRNTNAITSIRFFPDSGNFSTGSTFKLYGIQAGNA